VLLLLAVYDKMSFFILTHAFKISYQYVNTYLIKNALVASLKSR